MECSYCGNQFSYSKDYRFDCPGCTELKKRLFANSLDESEKYSSHKLKVTYNVECEEINNYNNTSKTKYYQEKKFLPLIKKFSRNDFDEMGRIKDLGNEILYFFYEIPTKEYESELKSWNCPDFKSTTNYEIIAAKLVRIPNTDKYILE